MRCCGRPTRSAATTTASTKASWPTTRSGLRARFRRRGRWRATSTRCAAAIAPEVTQRAAGPGRGLSASTPGGAPSPLVAVESPSLPRGHVQRHGRSTGRNGSRPGSGETQALEPLDGGGELVRAGSRHPRPVDQSRGRRRHRERFLSGDLATHARRITEAYENYSQLRVAAPAAPGRLPVALPDDDADDSGQRDLDGPVPREADHPAGAAAGRRRARDRRRPPRSPHRAGDARRVRIAGRGVQHDGRRAGRQPAQARALAARSRAQEPAARRAAPLHRNHPRADRDRRRLGRRRRRGSRRSTPRRSRLLELDRDVVGQPGAGGLRARGSAAARGAARQRVQTVVERSRRAGDRARARGPRAAPRRRRDAAAGRGRRVRRRGAGVRRRDAADPGAEGRGLARGGAPARARDQEPADADSAVRRAAAPPFQPARRRRRARWSTSARRRSSARSSR